MLYIYENYYYYYYSIYIYVFFFGAFKLTPVLSEVYFKLEKKKLISLVFSHP